MYMYLTIIPWAQMGSESIAHEAEGRMAYWLGGHEGKRNIIVFIVTSNYLVKYIENKKNSS